MLVSGRVRFLVSTIRNRDFSSQTDEVFEAFAPSGESHPRYENIKSTENVL